MDTTIIMEDFTLELPKKIIDESKQGVALTLEANSQPIGAKKFYIESYGCQMNFSDSEIVASILNQNGYSITRDFFEADLILINTCSIREKAEQTVRKRLTEFNAVKNRKPELIIGVLGCMAERLKKKFLEEEKIVDIVVGPDAYRSLPNLLIEAETGQKGVNVILSREETYADISPVRLDKNGVTAFVSIMRGCDNMCSFCVVPFTRGRERSRDPESIVQECITLLEKGYKEVTLLGQNVDSYKWIPEGTSEIRLNFAGLLAKVASISPYLRVRFSTSHPKDITDEVLYTMSNFDNICKYIHLPVQSGSSAVLERMNRTYNRDQYLDRVKAIKQILPECGISSDIITGFCGETDSDLQDTLSIMDIVRYDMSYMFYYSERPGTLAQRKYVDDIPLHIKKQRLQEIIEKQTAHSLENNKKDIGKTFEVLIEKVSRRSSAEFGGRTSQNKMVIFPSENAKIGDYVMVKIHNATSATLLGNIIKD